MAFARPLLATATSLPALGKTVLSLAARSGLSHWFFSELSRRLDHRVPVEATLSNGMRMQVFWNDAVGDGIRLAGRYEPETCSVLQRYLAPGKVFFDVGANVGLYTLLAAGMGAEVHAFEPDPRTFSLLERNSASNRLARVRVNQCALGDTPGRIEFFPGGIDNVGGGAISRHRATHGEACWVDCDTLDDYIHRVKPGRVSLIKIDVEGAETLVLRGARNLLEHHPAIVIEFSDKLQSAFGSSNAGLSALLSGAGYDLYRVLPERLEPYAPQSPEDSFFNVLCVPRGAAV